MPKRERDWLDQSMYETDLDYSGISFTVRDPTGHYNAEDMQRLRSVMELFGGMPIFSNAIFFRGPSDAMGESLMYMRGVRNVQSEMILMYLVVRVNAKMEIIGCNRNGQQGAADGYVLDYKEIPRDFKVYKPECPYKRSTIWDTPERKRIPVDPHRHLGVWFAPFYCTRF